MLTLKTDDTRIASISPADWTIDELLEKEWLLTNSRGGYAGGTVAGCNTRRYHGLLVGSLNPPVNRIVALSNCLETLIIAGREMHLSTFEFDDRLSPQGWQYLQEFQRDVGVQFRYRLNGIELTKSVYLDTDSDMVALVYTFAGVGDGLDFVLRPFVTLRDFHALQKSYANLTCLQQGPNLLVRHDVPYSCQLLLRPEDMGFQQDPQWWFNFSYRREKQRGQDYTEDLWSPGFFKCRVDSPARFVLWAKLYDADGHQTPPLSSAIADAKPDAGKFNLDRLRRKLRKEQSALLKNMDGKDPDLRTLWLASSQFIAQRQIIGKKSAATILAGFPWFADWGRDAFLALPGLLTCTGRLSEAESVLTTFAEAADEGMIPNRFDDYSNTAHYNSVDASLWFIHSAFEYLSAGGSSKIFDEKFLPVIRWIIERYYNGTKFDIHADADGLITGGSDQTQLTWMDARYQGTPFTPRCGKAVEVNALWYNALCRLAEFYRDSDIETAKHYGLMAEEVAQGFCKVFWNDFAECLYDCVRPDGTIDASLRPNQIFAVSLPFSPLSAQRQKKVVRRCQKDLLTPYGLRTLSPEDERYEGTYAGPQQQRDRAYHQGTVWPHLMGPFIEAYLKVNDFSKESKKDTMEFIRPLLEHLAADGCIASISEIFDGDTPHKPRGCIAQAWAVAELLRAYLLVTS